MRSQLRPVALLVLTASLPLASCMTAGENRHDLSLVEEQNKAGSKDQALGGAAAPGATHAAPPTAAPAAPVATGPTLDEQLAFIRKESAPAAPFSEQERLFVSQLPNSPQPGSVSEAALALGLVRLVLNPLSGEVETFKEADLGQPAQPAPGPGAAVGPAAPGTTIPGRGAAPSLEQLCHERGLNLPDALSENPLLGTVGVAKQVVAAMTQGELSLDFKNEVTAALKKEATAWSEVSGAATPPPQPEATPAPAALAATPPPAPEKDAGPPNPADLVGGDTVLAEAQALADRGNYQAAIKRAGAVGDGNPLRPQAQDKVKEFSNLAVQELRKKAASAFQSAMPVADPKTRAEYLQQAKGFLEEAIKDYPDATQLPTVRDNLRVISRDLDQLEGQARKGE